VALVKLNRKWHRWFAWGTSVFLLLWTATGVIMMLPAAPSGPAPGQISVPEGVLGPKAAVQVAGVDSAALRGLALRMLDQQLVWVVSARGRPRMIDAVSGAPVVIDAARATRLAVEGLGDSWEVDGVTRLDARDEHYGGPFPAWLVRFREQSYVAYVGPDGAVIFEGPRKRVRALAGRLHQFAFGGLTARRPLQRQGLLLVVSAGTLALLVTGVVLLLPPLRRRDR
jgi:hypothetical protein